MEILNYICIKGFVTKTVVCTINDEIKVNKIHNTENLVEIVGIKGSCNQWEFKITKQELADNFKLLN